MLWDCRVPYSVGTTVYDIVTGLEVIRIVLKSSIPDLQSSIGFFKGMFKEYGGILIAGCSVLVIPFTGYSLSPE
jgi:hypothetical protein